MGSNRTPVLRMRAVQFLHQAVPPKQTETPVVVLVHDREDPGVPRRHPRRNVGHHSGQQDVAGAFA